VARQGPRQGGKDKREKNLGLRVGSETLRIRVPRLGTESSRPGRLAKSDPICLPEGFLWGEPKNRSGQKSAAERNRQPQREGQKKHRLRSLKQEERSFFQTSSPTWEANEQNSKRKTGNLKLSHWMSSTKERKEILEKTLKKKAVFCHRSEFGVGPESQSWLCPPHDIGQEEGYDH